MSVTSPTPRSKTAACSNIGVSIAPVAVARGQVVGQPFQPASSAASRTGSRSRVPRAARKVGIEGESRAQATTTGTGYATDVRVAGHERQAFHHRLGHERPVERVAVMEREPAGDGACSTEGNGRREGPASAPAWPAGSRAARGRLDHGELPDRDGADGRRTSSQSLPRSAGGESRSRKSQIATCVSSRRLTVRSWRGARFPRSRGDLRRPARRIQAGS